MTTLSNSDIFEYIFGFITFDEFFTFDKIVTPDEVIVFDQIVVFDKFVIFDKFIDTIWLNISNENLIYMKCY